MVGVNKGTFFADGNNQQKIKKLYQKKKTENQEIFFVWAALMLKWTENLTRTIPKEGP